MFSPPPLKLHGPICCWLELESEPSAHILFCNRPSKSLHSVGREPQAGPDQEFQKGGDPWGGWVGVLPPMRVQAATSPLGGWGLSIPEADEFLYFENENVASPALKLYIINIHRYIYFCRGGVPESLGPLHLHPPFPDPALPSVNYFLKNCRL
ncbi:hypothetical protein PoB_004214800 [Plakobranchus ocellatus]|uniref:Uncharacterized protein n=1 Tax=Plakobranchus ocellatus TaxID=259542 RepID=A0AAV4B9Z5_9GAST|nr:hypothetical protein PoB_004214800 [Plakobranchus ocellatus]